MIFKRQAEISIHSTARVETLSILIFKRCMYISIHSTARVETKPRIFQISLVRDFNPLHREGGDLLVIQLPLHLLLFQSTPPRGWRQKYYTITTTILHHISTNKSYPTPLKSRPTIPAHSQIRSHCANFPVRIPP